jgi:hypothetical protein
MAAFANPDDAYIENGQVKFGEKHLPQPSRQELDAQAATLQLE